MVYASDEELTRLANTRGSFVPYVRVSGLVKEGDGGVYIAIDRVAHHPEAPRRFDYYASGVRIRFSKEEGQWVGHIASTWVE